MIDRELYFKKIVPFINKDLIKVFTGQRRVGKSMLLRLISKYVSLQLPEANIIFIDKEDYSFEAIKGHEDLNKYIAENKTEGFNYLFIDEIQEISGFEKVLRHYNKQSNFDVYCTGSNARMFSSELATLLSGRQVVFQIGSLDFREFCLFHNLEENNDSLLKYMRYGGLPYLIHLPDDEAIRFEYLNNIFSTILLRDVISRNNIRDPRFLNDLLRFLANNTGSLFSAQSISKYLKAQKIDKNVPIILSYISYLQDAYFINAVKRYDIHGKRQFEVGDKYYFEDIGLRNSIAGYKVRDTEKIIENIVFLHLRNHGYKVSVGALDNKEIDFVAERKGETSYLQVCYLLSNKDTIDREFGNLLQIKDNYPKYVISFDAFSSPNTYKGIEHLSLLEFLKSFV